ncbi:MAG: 50S ribosome-binding GTPase [Planctomycetes bacterium]|nr:50S ribosome-binding GTPase [Planctomycetota bacterium]
MNAQPESALTAAVLTPEGRGAVAVVGVCGPGATAACAKFFHPAGARPLAVTPHGQIRFGAWRNKSDETGGATAAEELVVCLRSVDDLEIHCHGGVAAAAAVCESLKSAGCRIVAADEWLAFREPDAVAREADLALAKVRTARAAGILLDQRAGALRNEVPAIEAALTAGDCASAASQLRILCDRGRLGLRLTEPFRVALAGRPNVGKSSLMNALVGHARALVFDEPGTTRDVVTSRAVFDGWAVELADTAGVRTTTSELEAAGIAAAVREHGRADLVLLLRDASEPAAAGDQELVERYPEALLVWNKIDRAAPTGLARLSGLEISALRGEGIDELIAAIVERLVSEVPPSGAAVPFTGRQLTILGDAAAHADQRDAGPASERLKHLFVAAVT